MRTKAERKHPVVDAMLDQLIEDNGIERDPVLEGISKILSSTPELLDWVERDLVAGLSNPKRGRTGLSAECVLRFAVLMRVRNWTYREARDRVSDSLYLRQFLRWGYGGLPKADAFNRGILRLSPSTVARIHEALVKRAVEGEVEDGSRLRVDTTVTEANIHYPTDSSLLRDGVRVLTRLVKRVREREPSVAEEFTDQTRSAKRLAHRIEEAARKRGEEKPALLKKHYKKLLRITRSARTMAMAIAAVVTKVTTDPVLRSLANAIERTGDLVEQVIVQTRRRVFLNDPVPAAEKIVSIFEPHTQIIVRGKVRKPTEYGRKLLFAQAGSGLISHFAVLDGNPNDVTQLPSILAVHRQQFGTAPNMLAGDRGFYSAENIRLLNEAGVATVSIPKSGTKSQAQIEREKSGDFRRGQKFRAGIEGTISVLKRGRGIARCMWHGDQGFRLLIGLSVVAQNLMLLAALRI